MAAKTWLAIFSIFNEIYRECGIADHFSSNYIFNHNETSGFENEAMRHKKFIKSIYRRG